LGAATLFIQLSVDAVVVVDVVVVVVFVAANLSLSLSLSLSLFWLESGAKTLTQRIDMATVSFHLFFLAHAPDLLLLMLLPLLSSSRQLPPIVLVACRLSNQFVRNH